MPHSMASSREKSEIVQGKSVPSAYPEPLRKKGVADRSTTRLTGTRFESASSPEIQSRAAFRFSRASSRSAPVSDSSSAPSPRSR